MLMCQSWFLLCSHKFCNQLSVWLWLIQTPPYTQQFKEMYLLLHYYLKHKNTAVILRKNALLAQNVRSKRCNCCLIVHRWVSCTFATSWMLQTVRWWKFRTLTVCSRTRRSCTSRKITSQPSWTSAGVCDGESRHSFLLTNSWINHLCFCFVFLKSS